MSRISTFDRKHFLVPEKCHWCGKEPPVYLWGNFNRHTFTGGGDVLCLCSGCALSVCRGLLMDMVADGVLTREDLVADMEKRAEEIQKLRGRSPEQVRAFIEARNGA